MLEIKNTEVFGIGRAIRSSGNPMTVGEIDTRCDLTQMSAENERHTIRAEKLGSSPVGSAHDHYLLGIHVQFDIKYPQYWTIESERYHNFEIISSQSKMHRLTMMGKDDDFEGMFNRYVDDDIIAFVKSFIDDYNNFTSLKQQEDGCYYTGIGDRLTRKDFEEGKYHLFMKCISNLPMGFEMWMTCDLTYLQLKTIYLQRKNHKLKEDWGAFCQWCESLPYFKSLVLGEKDD
jgi:hypothetical protein